MLATIGYIAPEYFRLPGYCSPSAGLGWARFVRFRRGSRTDTRKSACLFEQKPPVKMVADRPELHCPRSQSKHRPARTCSLPACLRLGRPQVRGHPQRGPGPLQDARGGSVVGTHGSSQCRAGIGTFCGNSQSLPLRWLIRWQKTGLHLCILSRVEPYATASPTSTASNHVEA